MTTSLDSLALPSPATLCSPAPATVEAVTIRAAIVINSPPLLVEFRILLMSVPLSIWKTTPYAPQIDYGKDRAMRTRSDKPFGNLQVKRKITYQKSIQAVFLPFRCRFSALHYLSRVFRVRVISRVCLIKNRLRLSRLLFNLNEIATIIQTKHLD